MGAYPATWRAVSGATIDMQAIGRVLREGLDQCIALDVAEVERSRMPELMKAAKKQKIRWRAEPYRPKRKRVIPDGIFMRDAVPIDGVEAVSAAIVEERSAVFEERPTDEAAMRFFASHIEPRCGAYRWAWPGSATRQSDSLFSPQGEIAAELERDPAHSRVAPNHAYADLCKVDCQRGQRRDVGQREAHSCRRGFCVEGRTIGDTILEMEGALYEYSQLCAGVSWPGTPVDVARPHGHGDQPSTPGGGSGVVRWSGHVRLPQRAQTSLVSDSGRYQTRMPIQWQSRSDLC